MYRNIAERLVDWYPYDWKENLRMREACICSVEIVCSTLINIMLVIVLACVLSKEIECLIFFSINGTTRLFSGGVHAKNHRRCILFYIGVLLTSIYIADVLEQIRYGVYLLCIPVLLISISVNLKYAGMQKQLQAAERKQYRKACMRFVTFYNGLLLTICILEIVAGIDIGTAVRNNVYVGAFALLAQSISLFIGRKDCINYRE